MEATVIDFILSTLMSFSAQYPDAAWLVTALSVVMTVCGLCAVATAWMPVPKETDGALCRRLPLGPCPCRAFRAEQGCRGGRQVRNREGRSQGRDGEVMRGPSLSSFHRSPGSSSCGCANGTANAARLIALLFVMTLAASGCSSSGRDRPPRQARPPLTPGAVVTGEWSYTYRGETFTEPGEWVHLPAGEAGNLLLWIKGVEAEQ